MKYIYLIKLRKLQSDFDEKFLNEKSEIEMLNDEIFILQQKLYEKESVFVNIKRENEKIVRQENYKEIYISDPTMINVELNNEVNYSRDIMTKVSKMLNLEKSKNEKFEKKIRKLEEEYEELKKIKINVPLNDNNIKNDDYNKNINRIGSLNKINNNNYSINNNYGLNNYNNINPQSSKISIIMNSKNNINIDTNSVLNSSLNNFCNNKCKLVKFDIKK